MFVYNRESMQEIFWNRHNEMFRRNLSVRKSECILFLNKIKPEFYHFICQHTKLHNTKTEFQKLLKS